MHDARHIYASKVIKLQNEVYDKRPQDPSPEHAPLAHAEQAYVYAKKKLGLIQEVPLALHGPADLGAHQVGPVDRH